MSQVMELIGGAVAMLAIIAVIVGLAEEEPVITLGGLAVLLGFVAGIAVGYHAVAGAETADILLAAVRGLRA